MNAQFPDPYKPKKQNAHSEAAQNRRPRRTFGDILGIIVAWPLIIALGLCIPYVVLRGLLFVIEYPAYALVSGVFILGVLISLVLVFATLRGVISGDLSLTPLNAVQYLLSLAGTVVLLIMLTALPCILLSDVRSYALDVAISYAPFTTVSSLLVCLYSLVLFVGMLAIATYRRMRYRY